MYDLIDKLITVTNKDKNQQEVQVMYEAHEDYDEHLHEKDLHVLDDHVNVLNKIKLNFKTKNKFISYELLNKKIMKNNVEDLYLLLIMLLLLLVVHVMLMNIVILNVQFSLNDLLQEKIF